MKIDFEQGREILEARLDALETLQGTSRLAIGPESELTLLSLEEIPPPPPSLRGRVIMTPRNPDGSYRERHVLLDGKPWTRPAGHHLYEGHMLWVPTRGSSTWTGSLIDPDPDGSGSGSRTGSRTISDGMTSSYLRCAPSRSVGISISLAGFEVTLKTFTASSRNPESGPGANLEAVGRVRSCYWEALREAGAALEALHAKCAPSWLELLRLGAKENPHGKEEE